LTASVVTEIKRVVQMPSTAAAGTQTSGSGAAWAEAAHRTAAVANAAQPASRREFTRV